MRQACWTICVMRWLQDHCLRAIIFNLHFAGQRIIRSAELCLCKGRVLPGPTFNTTSELGFEGSPCSTVIWQAPVKIGGQPPHTTDDPETSVAKGAADSAADAVPMLVKANAAIAISSVVFISVFLSGPARAKTAGLGQAA